MFSSVEIKKNGEKYQLFIDGKFIKDSRDIMELAKEIEKH